MKALPFKVPKPENTFLKYQEDVGSNFYDQFHQHEEIQISLIQNGSGILMVGDSIHNYNRDDIFILGSKLPHVFIDDENLGAVKMISMFFNVNDNEAKLFELEELNKILTFLKSTKNGLKIESGHKKAKELILGFKGKNKFQTFISFLSLLEALRLSTKSTLSKDILNTSYSNLQGQRMQRVINYTFENYKNEISLDSISNIANLSKNAFCKYFKKHTNKSYISFINELRTNYASKQLLTKPEALIVEIAEASGFNNLSNFNRQFKKYYGQTPKELRATL